MVGLFVGTAVLASCGTNESQDVASNQDAWTAEAVEAPACEPSPGMPLEGRASPYDSATLAVGEGAAKVCYGRPSLRGREMIGGEAVPYGRLWRTGANEPTILHVNVPARVAGLRVEPGSYSLYTVPEPGLEWTLIVNRATTQWGHESRYTDEVAAQEVGRAPVPVESAAETVEQLTIRPSERGDGLFLEWQNTRVFIPIEAA